MTTVRPAGAEQDDERILVLAPIGRDGELISSAMAAAGLRALVCADAGRLFAELPRGAGAVVVTEEVLDAPTLATLATAVRRQPTWSDVPIVILTSADRGANAVPLSLVGLEALGNVTLLERPVRVLTLVSTARSALRARRRQYEVRDHLVDRERDAQELHARAEQTDRGRQ